MTREKLLRDYIEKQWGSVSKFAQSTGIPQTTVYSMLKRDIMNCSLSKVFSICDRLGIEVEALVNGEIKEKGPHLEELTPKDRKIINAYHNMPSMNAAVDKLLNITNDNQTVSDGISISVEEAMKKVTVNK